MYDVRHSIFHNIITNGADLAAVSRLLGHSSTKMTADTYYHVIEAGYEHR
jgi:site-specific recombinase XerD